MRGLDHLHATLVAHRTGSTRLGLSAYLLWLWGAPACGQRVRHQDGGVLPQEGATEGQLRLTMTVREKAKRADLVQALGQHMQAKPAQEFDRVEGVGAQLPRALGVLEAEGDLAVLESA